MKHLAPLCIAFSFAVASPSLAEEPGTGEGFNLIEEGAKLLLRGLQQEMQPMMEDLAIEMEPKLREFAEDMLPLVEQFRDLAGNLDQYHAPEMLPNGDIILRRKTPQDLAEEDEEGEIEL